MACCFRPKFDPLFIERFLMTECNSCKTKNNPGQKFCGQCGAGLSQGCAECGATKVEGHKFCGQCGTVHDVIATKPNPAPAPAVGINPSHNISATPLKTSILTNLISSPLKEPDLQAVLARAFELQSEIKEIYENVRSGGGKVGHQRTLCDSDGKEILAIEMSCKKNFWLDGVLAAVYFWDEALEDRFVSKVAHYTGHNSPFAEHCHVFSSEHDGINTLRFIDELGGHEDMALITAIVENVIGISPSDWNNYPD